MDDEGEEIPDVVTVLGRLGKELVDLGAVEGFNPAAGGVGQEFGGKMADDKVFFGGEEFFELDDAGEALPF